MATPMAALPAAPAPPRPRLLMIATALAVGAATMLFGGLLGIYLNVREAAGGTTAEWVPSSITFPEIAVNTVAITLVCSVVIIHWALWAIGNGDRRNTYIALGLTIVLGFAALNALAFSFNQMHLAVRDNVYSVMVATVGGTFHGAPRRSDGLHRPHDVPHTRRPVLDQRARGHRRGDVVLGLHRRRVPGRLVLHVHPQVGTAMFTTGAKFFYGLSVLGVIGAVAYGFNSDWDPFGLVIFSSVALAAFFLGSITQAYRDATVPVSVGAVSAADAEGELRHRAGGLAERVACGRRVRAVAHGDRPRHRTVGVPRRARAAGCSDDRMDGAGMVRPRVG